MSTGQFRSVFDIIGPVMIGPSSSHTAGAARIGKIIREIFGETPEQVDILLYESFAKTYRGHGTDIALVGGLLGMEPDDPRLSSSLKLAHEAGIEVAFVPKKEQADHPNQVTMRLIKGERKLSVTGISIGGGNIQITEINGFKIALNAGVPTFIIVHKDITGAVANVTRIFQEQNINIAIMNVTRENKGGNAMMVIEVDSPTADSCIPELEQLSEIQNVSFFN